MALSRVKTWISGEVLTASDLNSEFNNILNNPSSLITPIGFNLTFTDATYDIGASGATRPRDLFLSRNAVIGGTLTPSQTSGIVGTTTNNNANAGSYGEYTESVVGSGSAVSLTTATTANITSLSLTAGDWEVWGTTFLQLTTTTNLVSAFNGTSTTSATFGAADTLNTVAQNASAGIAYGNSPLFRAATQRIRYSLSATTTVYLVANANFTVDTATVYGTLRARRIR